MQDIERSLASLSGISFGARPQTLSPQAGKPSTKVSKHQKEKDRLRSRGHGESSNVEIWDDLKSFPGQLTYSRIAAKLLGLTDEEWVEGKLLVTNPDIPSATIDSFTQVKTTGLIQVCFMHTNVAPSEKISDVRGTVVDIDRKTIVCGGSTHTYEAIWNEENIDLTSYPGYMIVTDNDADKRKKHVIPIPGLSDEELEMLEDPISVHTKVYGTDLYIGEKVSHISPIQQRNMKVSIARPAVEGPYIQIFKNNGNVYFAGHRKLDVRRSYYGSSKHYKTLWKEAGGVDPEKLFPSGVRHSPYVFRFLLCYQEKSSYTNMNIGRPYIAFLGVNQMWSIPEVESEEYTGFSNNPEAGLSFVGYVHDENGEPTTTIGDNRTPVELLNIKALFEHGVSIAYTQEELTRKRGSLPKLFFPNKSLTLDEMISTLRVRDVARPGSPPPDENVIPRGSRTHGIPLLPLPDLYPDEDPLRPQGEAVIISWLSASGYWKSLRFFSQGLHIRGRILNGKGKETFFNFIDSGREDLSASIKSNRFFERTPRPLDVVLKSQTQQMTENAQSLLEQSDVKAETDITGAYISEKLISNILKYRSDPLLSNTSLWELYGVISATYFIALAPVARIPEFFYYYNELFTETEELINFLSSMVSQRFMYNISTCQHHETIEKILIGPQKVFDGLVAKHSRILTDYIKTDALVKKEVTPLIRENIAKLNVSKRKKAIKCMKLFKEPSYREATRANIVTFRDSNRKYAERKKQVNRERSFEREKSSFGDYILDSQPSRNVTTRRKPATAAGSRPVRVTAPKPKEVTPEARREDVYNRMMNTGMPTPAQASGITEYTGEYTGLDGDW